MRPRFDTFRGLSEFLKQELKERMEQGGGEQEKQSDFENFPASAPGTWNEMDSSGDSEADEEFHPGTMIYGKKKPPKKPNCSGECIGDLGNDSPECLTCLLSLCRWRYKYDKKEYNDLCKGKL